MSIFYEERHSDSPYVQRVTYGGTSATGTAMRPAETNWHMVMVKQAGQTQLLVVGPWRTSGEIDFEGGAEVLWIRFKLGVFMPHLPTRKITDSETPLPEAACNSFWLKSSTWQLPDYENVDTFINRLMREEILVFDPLIHDSLRGTQPDLSPRTIRHRFAQAAGMSQRHIEQVQRAQHAQQLLQQGRSILDTVHEAGYFDQPHLTRSLKQYIGYTPAQIIRMNHTANA